MNPDRLHLTEAGVSRKPQRPEMSLCGQEGLSGDIQGFTQLKVNTNGNIKIELLRIFSVVCVMDIGWYLQCGSVTLCA